MAAPVCAQHEWTQFGGGPLHGSSTGETVQALGTPAWVRSTDAQGNVITFSGQSGVVASLDLVFAQGSVTPPALAKQHRLFAFDRRTGIVVWAAAVPAPVLESWSTPVVDVFHRTVLVASGAFVTALNIKTGAQLWQAGLAHPVVDASPVVTSGWGPGGLGIANRCFVTEYDGFGDDGRLTCINVDPYLAGRNPYQPGEVVWSVAIDGSSGNTPAVWKGLVFVTNAGVLGSGPGKVMAFDARANAEAAPVWAAENPVGEVFFGGVCVRERAGGADLFCASYAFFGGTASSNLVKVDALTGAVRWSAPCNRTSATPVVLPDGRVAVSGGVRGFGTVPTLQLFRDDGTSAALLWDSSLAGVSIGGWSHQPLLAAGGGARLLCGTLPTSPTATGACTDLYAIDVSKLPTSPGAALPGYLAQHFTGAGSTPAVAGGNVYTLGPGGLYAFGSAPLRYDVDGDGRLDIEDLYAWEGGLGVRDVDLSGQVTSADRDALITELRRDEDADMRGGKP